MGAAELSLLFFSLMLIICGSVSDAVYYGAKINDFSNRFHNIKGEVYAVDSRTLFIKVSIDYIIIYKYSGVPK